MTKINSGSNTGGGLPISTESTELADLVQSTDRELKQIAQNPASGPEARKPAAEGESATQVTGRRASVRLGGMSQQYALNSKFDAKSAGAQPSGKLAVGKDEEPPPPTTAAQKAADQIYDKIKSKVGKMPDLRSGNYPELSKEEQMAADFGAGIGKYKEYVDYAKKTLAKFKDLPEPMRENLKRLMGDRLEKLSAFLDGTASKLGKIAKYADMVKDAAGITTSVRDLAADFKNMDFKNPASVEKVMDSLGRANDRVQGALSGLTESLITKGTQVGATGALVTAYVGFMITAGIELGRYGVKTEKLYYEKYQERMRIIDNTGVDPRRNVQLPNEPPPLKTYEQLRNEEQGFYRSAVRTNVEVEFRKPRQEVKQNFDATHSQVRDQFTNEVFPKMYLQRRDQILDQLRAAKREVESNYNTGTTKDRFAQSQALQSLIDQMEEHQRADKEGGTALTPAEIQNEISLFQQSSMSPGPIKDTLTRLYSKELDKFYEQKGVGDGALEKAYEKAGVSDDVVERMVQEKLREAGL